MRRGLESPSTGEESGNREAKQHAPGHTASEKQSSVSDPGGRAQSHFLLFTKAKKENESRGRKKKNEVIQLEIKTYPKCE